MADSLSVLYDLPPNATNTQALAWVNRMRRIVRHWPRFPGGRRFNSSAATEAYRALDSTELLVLINMGSIRSQLGGVRAKICGRSGFFSVAFGFSCEVVIPLCTVLWGLEAIAPFLGRSVSVAAPWGFLRRPKPGPEALASDLSRAAARRHPPLGLPPESRALSNSDLLSHARPCGHSAP